jgi:hypothetical protein
MSKPSSAPSQRHLFLGKLIRQKLADVQSRPRPLSFVLLGFLLAFAFVPDRAWSESRAFTVKINFIEAMLVDRGSGQLSANIVDADRKLFVSSGGLNQTRTKSADDVFLRISFSALADGNIQPLISVVVLAHYEAVEGPGIEVVHWQNVPEYPGIFDAEGRGTVTALLKNVTCSKLDVVVNIGSDYASGQSETALLPFECKE